MFSSDNYHLALDAAPWVICLLILAWALTTYANFARKLTPVEAEIVEAKLAVEGYQAGRLTLEELTDQLSRLPTISDGWAAFRKTLVIDEDELLGTRQISSTQNIGHFLNEASITGRAIDIRFYQSMPNMFVGVGLLFTFLGLILALLSASAGVSAVNVADAQQALKGLLGAAGFKFLSSLAGLLSSLVFSWRENARLYKVDNAISDINKSIELAFTPISTELLAYQRNKLLERQEALLREQLDESRQMTAQIKRFETDFAVSIATALDNKLSPKIEELASTLSGATTQLLEKIGSVNENALDIMVKDFGKVMSEGTGQQVTEMSEAIKSISERLEATGTVLEDKFKGAGDDIASGATLLNEIMINLKAELVDFQQVVNQLNVNGEKITSLLGTNVIDLSTLHRELGTTLSGIGNVADSFEATAGKMTVSAKDIALAQEAANEKVQKMLLAAETTLKSVQDGSVQLNTVIEALRSAWESHRSRFEDVDEDVERLFISLKDGLENYSEKVASFHEGLTGNLTEALQSLSTLVAELSNAVEELIDAQPTKS